MNKSSLEEIAGFSSPGEYIRFNKFIDELLAIGEIEEIDIDKDYHSGMVYGGRWFREVGNSNIWRLVPPDFPYRGVWERVII